MNRIGKGGRLLLGTGVDLGNVCKEVEDTAGVTPLVVVPGDELDEVVVEGDTSGGIEDRGGVVSVHVGGDNSVLSVGKDTCDILARFWSQSEGGSSLPFISFSEAFLMTALIWS